jgi:hypothetical protein
VAESALDQRLVASATRGDTAAASRRNSELTAAPVSNRDGSYGVYVMNADGSGQRKLAQRSPYPHRPQ